MCGIVGLAGDFSRDSCLEIVRKMNESIVHRGPDDQGTWAEDGFGFGMRRLSIIDIEGGHQPMFDDGSGVGVVFNGEIFNYLKVRKTLESGGERQWATRSDTEVVLKSFALYGEESIQHWNGMFATALWDTTRKRLTLIRDRMGVKPLYYFWDGRTLVFASEIKAIMASGVVGREINLQAVWDYLTFRYVPGPETIWRGIRKLPPGHLLRYTPGAEPEEVRYWQCEVVSSERDDRSEEEIDKEFAEVFLDAVELRLVASDVPVGVFLSGGLDSSAIAAAAVELGHKNFHTFSVGFEEGGEFSELAYARQVAKHVGAQHHEVIVDQQGFLDMLPEVVFAADEPLADLTLVPLLALSRLARKDVKVVLSGEGSDEILAGYDLDAHERQWDKVRALQRLPRPVLQMGAALSRFTLPEATHRRAQKLSELPLKEWNRLALPHMTKHWDQSEKQELWPAGISLDSERILARQYADTTSDDPLQQMLSIYQQSWLVEDLLMKADKMSMASSLEVRTPFLDYRLVEWANRQPNFVKVKRTGIREYRTKNILRRFCQKRLPAEILSRPKQGFPVPAYVWLQNGLDGWATEKLLGTESRLAHVFRLDPIRRAIREAQLKATEGSQRVWILLLLEYWLRAWDVELGGI